MAEARSLPYEERDLTARELVVAMAVVGKSQMCHYPQLSRRELETPVCVVRVSDGGESGEARRK